MALEGIRTRPTNTLDDARRENSRLRKLLATEQRERDATRKYAAILRALLEQALPIIGSDPADATLSRAIFEVLSNAKPQELSDDDSRN